MSTVKLAVAKPVQPSLWRSALETAVREEFLGSPFVPPPGSPLLPAECAVDGCLRTGFRAPWDRFRTRLCHAHAHHWVGDGRPADADRWLRTQLPMKIMRPSVKCTVATCPRSRLKGRLVPRP